MYFENLIVVDSNEETNNEEEQLGDVTSIVQLCSEVSEFLSSDFLKFLQKPPLSEEERIWLLMT